MKTFALLAALSLFALRAFSATLNVAADDSSGFSYLASSLTAASIFPTNPELAALVAAGDDLQIGTSVLVGGFESLTSAQVRENAQDYNFLLENFAIWGGTQIGAGDTPEGLFSPEIPLVNSVPSLAGKQIYILVVAGTNNSTPQASLFSAFQVGLYYFDMALNANWAFPSDAGAPGFTTIDIADLTVDNAGTTLKEGAQVVLGGFGADDNNTIEGAKNFSLAAVPEPSAAVLLGLTLAGVAGFWRRRGK